MVMLRFGFVSNSSSCSFSLQKANLSEKEIEFVRNWQEWAKVCYPEDEEHNIYSWSTEELDDAFVFDTSMDNFGLLDFFLDVGFAGEIRDVDH